MELKNFCTTLLNQLPDGIYCVDTNRRICFWNHAAEEITGFAAGEIVGLQCQNTLLNHIDTKGNPLCSYGCPLYATLADGKTREELVFVRHKEGFRLPVHVKIFPLYEEEKIVAAVEIFRKNSPAVYEDNLIDTLTDAAMHDALTKLPNRRHLEKCLNYRLEEFRRFERPFAVLFADVDHFSIFNNTYGHDTGDVILKEIARNLLHSMDADHTAGRWGGEEFVAICAISSCSDVQKIGEAFREAVEKSTIEHNGHQLHVTISVGAAMVRKGDTASSIVERADALMYQSKTAGRNQLHWSK